MTAPKGPPSFIQPKDADGSLGALLDLWAGAAVWSNDARADVKLKAIFELIASFIRSDQFILPLPALLVLAPITAVVEVRPGEGKVLKALMMLWPEMFDGLQGLVIHRPGIAEGAVTLRHLPQFMHQPFAGGFILVRIPSELSRGVFLPQFHPLLIPLGGLELEHLGFGRAFQLSHAAALACFF